MRVAVLGGGRSSEHEVSLSSAAAVRAGLAEAGHEVVEVLLDREGGWLCDGEPVALRPGGGLLGADVVFPVLHGPFGEDGTVQGLLELLGVAYVGAGVLASALCMDKVLFKDLMAAHGIPQVDYRSSNTSLDFGFPVFVKPARLGSSVGISKVTNQEELDAAMQEALAHDPQVIIEAMSLGLEVECAVLGNDEAEASLPGEIVINAEWYDYEAKYTPGGMELVVPPRISDAAAARVRELALEVFRIAGCAGLARVDFFVEDGDRVLVNELNTMPGFTETSVYPKLWEATGVPFPDLVDRLVRLGVGRHERESRYRF
jgi:D-alanine-D-alanine ligase